MNKKILNQLVDKKLFPKVVYQSEEKDFLIYEHVESIKSNKDKRGFFREIFRPDEISHKINIKQISHSFIKKNIIKARVEESIKELKSKLFEQSWEYIKKNHNKS